MKEGLLAKFLQNPVLAKKLKDTNNRTLVEATRDGTGTVRVRWRVNKVRSGISDSYQGTFRYTGPYPGNVPAVPRETYLRGTYHTALLGGRDPDARSQNQDQMLARKKQIGNNSQ